MHHIDEEEEAQEEEEVQEEEVQEEEEEEAAAEEAEVLEIAFPPVNLADIPVIPQFNHILDEFDRFLQVQQFKFNENHQIGNTDLLDRFALT